MNVLKKFAVSLTALTTLATLGIGSFSVSANGLTTEEDKFIASYKNADEIKAANYYLENGLSVEEAKKMMDLYQEGALQIAASKNPMARTVNAPVNFYSDTNLSRNQHYGIIIADNGKANVDATLSIGYSNQLISPNINSVSELGSYVEVYRKTDLQNEVKIKAELTPSTSNEVPVGVCDIPLNIISNSFTSEVALYNSLTLTVSECDSLDGSNTTFRLETYVAGDVNHDGKVNASDVKYLTDYNLGVKNIEDILDDCEYTDTHENVSNIVNKRAMDADKNGYISISDLTAISKIVE